MTVRFGVEQVVNTHDGVNFLVKPSRNQMRKARRGDALFVASNDCRPIPVSVSAFGKKEIAVQRKT